ncbi:glutaredoxin domain-containing protein [uncultured Azohydromonas sp.]|uniref:glutaredoxin family protein n=1 Tax=uncultured Azohydromonas sp. TaxID=487342 RepID=UPI00261CF3D3|nr:glutaredoxin domain-containing protein [uncultured Azohydromonas sp.]
MDTGGLRATMPFMNFRIVVYSQPACPQCDTAKKLLHSKGLPFELIQIHDQGQRTAFLKRFDLRVQQLPQVFINEQHVGGVVGLQSALKRIGL